MCKTPRVYKSRSCWHKALPSRLEHWLSLEKDHRPKTGYTSGALSWQTKGGAEWGAELPLPILRFSSHKSWDGAVVFGVLHNFEEGGFLRGGLRKMPIYFLCNFFTLDMWRMTCDRLYVTCEMRHVTCGMWHLTCDMGHLVGCEPSCNFSGP